MVANISRLLSLSNKSLKLRGLVGHIPRRYVQEFPEQRLDNSARKDYLLVLPEKLNEIGNESLRVPQPGEPEINFVSLSAESCFKGLSQTICNFENYVTDINNQVSLPYNSVAELFKDVERQLYPMDFACNILNIARTMNPEKYFYRELTELIERYYDVRDLRRLGNFKQALAKHLYDKNLSDCERMLIKLYKVAPFRQGGIQTFDETTMFMLEENLRKDLNVFVRNVHEANNLFSHTIDEPDILAAVSSDFDDCQDPHHRERTPLRITVGTYHKFMQMCPDRLVRQMMWQTYNKRCSPRALPKLNNRKLLMGIFSLRRKISDLMGHRSHLECRLENTMASTRQRVMESLTAINQDNLAKLNERLQELYEFAIDNKLDDPSYLGLREYDIDYYAQRYKYDILIGVNEMDLRSFFPLRAVMSGIQNFFSKYLSIELTPGSSKSGDGFWSQHVRQIEVRRHGQLVGTILFDPFSRQPSRPYEISFARLRNHVEGAKHMPAQIIATPFKLDPAKGEAHLSFTEVTSLLYGFADTIQMLLRNSPYYELNLVGVLEHDVRNLFPNLIVGHLLSDHKLLQTFSNRGNSKPIDSELASRIIKATVYLRPFKTWYQLYKAHLDQEAHSLMSDTGKLADKIYTNYCPFERDRNNYDYCAMVDVFVGPNDGIQYADLWSRQLATFCLSHIHDADGRIDDAKAKEFYGKLLDSLLDTSNLNFGQKLTALVGKQFEPSKTTLSVL